MALQSVRGTSSAARNLYALRKEVATNPLVHRPRPLVREWMHVDGAVARRVCVPIYAGWKFSVGKQQSFQDTMNKQMR